MSGPLTGPLTGAGRTARVGVPPRHRLAGWGLLVAVGCATAGAGAPAWATWGDSARVESSSFAAGVVDAPVLTCTAPLVGPLQFSWASVPGATGYTFHHGSGGTLTSLLDAATTTVSVAAGSGAAWVEAHRAFGAPVTTTWTSAQSNAFSYSVLTVPTVSGSCAAS